jgi:hypothetical protein
MNIISILQKIDQYEQGIYNCIKSCVLHKQIALQKDIDTLGDGYQIVPINGTQLYKVIKDGKVAVAISDGYGAGWSTWNNVHPLDAQFNVLFLKGQKDEALELCASDDIFGYCGGGEDIHIAWIRIGAIFKIDEYDGAESIELRDMIEWHTA